MNKSHRPSKIQKSNTSMYFKNKKTVIKDDNSFSKNSNLDKFKESKDFKNIIIPKERRTIVNTNNNLINSMFDINNYDSINNYDTFNNDDDYFEEDSIISNSYNDNKMKLLYLTKEKMELNNNNIKLLELLNENNKKNAELKGYLEEYKKKDLLAKAKFIGHLEKLKHRSKEINFNSDILHKKNINYENINEIKKENEYLIEKIKIKNNDFQNLYDFVMEIISNNEPYMKEFKNNVNELNSFKNNKLKDSNSLNKKISVEIIGMKNDYENLKIKYNELLEKMKNEDVKEESQKQKVKFISKDISEKTKGEYESKINKLKEDNSKLTNDYKLQIENLKKELSELKLKNENKEKQLKILSEKYQKTIDSLNEKLKEKKNNSK